jgi:hypothetical protein
MRSPLLLVPSFLAAAALACGESSGPNPTAASVTGVAGDGQTASLGSVVASPLSFIALGSTGQPVQGVAVNWTVSPAGAATFSPQSSTTNASGSASTTVTVGTVAGDLTISANVAGVSPVVYHVQAVDVCNLRVDYTIGTTVNGTLASSDCRLGGNYYTDFYEFTVGAQSAITGTMTSGAFNAWLDVYRGSGRQMGAANDIGGGNLNAQIELIVAPGTYVFAPNSFNEFSTGAYSLSSAAHPINVAACGEYWVTRNVTITDSLVPTDCVDSVSTDVFYADLVGLIAFASDTIKVTQRSAAMDPLLQLFRVDQNTGGFVLVASNDDSSASTTDAFVSAAVTSTGVYVIYAGSADTASAGDGAYTLTVGGSVSLGPSPMPTPALRARGPGPFGGSPALPKRAVPR